MAVAAVAAVPAASKVLEAGVEMAKSVVAQIAAALGTPLAAYENVRVRPSKKGGTETTTTRATMPAWFFIGGAALALFAVTTMYTHESQRAGGFLSPVVFTQAFPGWYSNLERFGKEHPPPPPPPPPVPGQAAYSEWWMLPPLVPGLKR